jgi:protein TonB
MAPHAAADMPMTASSSTPPRRSFDLAAWRPSPKALWLVLAAFVVGLALFALVWSGDRNRDDFYRVEGTPPTAAPDQYEPLPVPLPARGGEASGLDPERQPQVADEPAASEGLPHLVEAPPPPPEAAPAPAPTAGALVPPRPLPGSMPSPRYPLRALRRGERGTVMVRARIGPDGVPTSVTVANSSGSRLLDRAATDAVERWRFEPAMRDGRPTVGTVEVPISFEAPR